MFKGVLKAYNLICPLISTMQQTILIVGLIGV